MALPAERSAFGFKTGTVRTIGPVRLVRVPEQSRNWSWTAQPAGITRQRPIAERDDDVKDRTTGPTGDVGDAVERIDRSATTSQPRETAVRKDWPDRGGGRGARRVVTTQGGLPATSLARANTSVRPTEAPRTEGPPADMSARPSSHAGTNSPPSQERRSPLRGDAAARKDAAAPGSLPSTSSPSSDARHEPRVPSTRGADERTDRRGSKRSDVAPSLADTLASRPDEHSLGPKTVNRAERRRSNAHGVETHGPATDHEGETELVRRSRALRAAGAGRDDRQGSQDAPRSINRSAEHARTPSRPVFRSRQDEPAYAALDLGTNNCRLLIATPTRGRHFRVVDAFSRIVRLGQGLGRTDALDEGAMDRAVAALRQCALKLNGRPIRRRRLIATEACRRAINGAGFIARVRAETGLVLEVVDRKTEAHLAVAGCSSLIDRDARGVVLFDIGGGSTEIALLDLTGPHRHSPARSIAAWTSLPVGVVTLSERFGGREVNPALFEEMTRSVLGMIEGFGGRNRLRRTVGTRRFHLLGTSGTVTTLAGLHLGLERYDRRRVDGLWMSADDIERTQDALVNSSFAERRRSPCIGSDRADLVLAGCAILEAIRRTWPSDRLRVADRGLREGMLSDMMVSDDAWNRSRERGR